MNVLFETGQDGSTATTHDWLTPPEILHALGVFDLDPCASEHQPWATACKHLTVKDDGLSKPWAGRVWCNPPYSSILPWVQKAWAEWKTSDGIAMLLPANRTEQGWWQEHVEPNRHLDWMSTHFLRGRRRFIQAGATEIKPNERPPFGLVVVTIGLRD